MNLSFITNSSIFQADSEGGAYERWIQMDISYFRTRSRSYAITRGDQTIRQMGTHTVSTRVCMYSTWMDNQQTQKIGHSALFP